MELKEREAIVNQINTLFGGVVRAHESQITEEVALYVDQMFREITSCHEGLAPFAMVLEGIAKAIDFIIPDEVKVLMGGMSIAEYIEEKGTAHLIDLVKASKIKDAYDIISDIHEIWMKYTDGDRRFQVCINVARLNWRSKIELALMGL